MSCILPIIPTDLHQYESYERLIEALENLEGVFNQTVGAISARVSECNARVENISGRVAQAQQKITQVAGTTKAIQILSCPEYPKLPGRNDQLIPPQPRPPKYHPTVHETEDPGASPSGSVRDVDTLTSLYQTNQIPTPSFLEKPQQHNEVMLGNMPESLSAITSLLLFNSDENPYCIQDTDLRQEGQPELPHRRTFSGVPTLPPTLQEFADLENAKQDQMFMPQQEATPNIDMPSQLMIPGIANFGDEDDLDDDDDTFAFNVIPSKKIGQLPSLPAHEQKPLPELPGKPLPPVPGAHSESSSPAQSPTKPANVPPPPPPMPVISMTPAPQQVPPPPPPMQMRTTVAPPPPPPMPMKGSVPPPPKNVDLPKPENPDAREKLLSDIRVENPMARLRKVTTREPSNPLAKKETEIELGKATNRQDAFAQLKAKIALRFNEIHAPPVVSKPKESFKEQYKNKSGSDWSGSESD